MGIFSSKKDKPFFSPDGKQEFEIKTDRNFGFPIEIQKCPEELQPNRYYILGEVSDLVKILKLVVNTEGYVETYSGEFTIREGGEVTFPSSIKWVENPDFSEKDYTYQFEIKNGIGTFVKVSTQWC